MPGVHRLSLDTLLHEIRALSEEGVFCLNLYPVIPLEKKDARGTYALHPDNFLLQAIQTIKSQWPHMCILSDVALDPYTTHGHDGIVDAAGHVRNDETVVMLGEMARLHAAAGVDSVAPSDMMDGRVGFIRKILDRSGFSDVGIVSYTAKYCSALYRPFREALHSAPRFGNKKAYQMNPANWREALQEAELDIAEGADCLLLKPALPYLDVLCRLREKVQLPLLAFQVSGEYAMIMAAAEKGWLDGGQSLYECALSIKRAGADSIITYGALALAKRLNRMSADEESVSDAPASRFIADGVKPLPLGVGI